MSRELLALLGEATGLDVRWNDIVVMNNVGAIPPVKDVPGDYVWNRGFNAVVLNAMGSPQYFCKCRAVGDERLAHEAASMLALRETANLRDCVPPTMQARSDKIRVLATRFMSGKPLNEVFDRRLSTRLEQIVRDTIDAMVGMSQQATQSLSTLLEGSVIDVGRESAELIRYLVQVGLPEQDARLISDAIEDGHELPCQLQHGDLWPANIVRDGRTLWFLDFEMYGRVQVPMYDVFHFLRTTVDRWTEPGGPLWIEQMIGGGRVGKLMCSEIKRAAAALQLTSIQTVNALIFYITHFAVTTHKRNPNGEVWKLFYDEVRALPSHIGRGHLHTLFASSPTAQPRNLLAANQRP